MRNRLLIYGILISIGIHFIILSNISFDIKDNKPLNIQLVKMPPGLIKENLSPQKKIKKKYNKKFKKEDIISKENLSKEEVYCDLCEPVKDFKRPKDELIFGDSVKSISMIYKVLHDLGPTKGAMSKIRPFGSDGQVIGSNKYNSKSLVGNLTIQYKVDKKKYFIDYEAKATGVSSLFYSKPLIQKSRGTINALGLRPDYFLYNHGKKKKSEVYFDWSRKILIINRKGSEKKYDLTNQAQDQLSFMFQFMFLDPLNKMQIPITNAKVFKIYNYHYVDEIKIDTKLGNLDVLHVAKFNYQSPERIDLWLSKKFGYLPVKISITEDDLSRIIQEIDNLEIEKTHE
tara:strand:+ start:1174 stop:2202 length:1029 start_codon:yes stop_codon:yes gene_type:complete